MIGWETGGKEMTKEQAKKLYRKFLSRRRNFTLDFIDYLYKEGFEIQDRYIADERKAKTEIKEIYGIKRFY